MVSILYLSSWMAFVRMTLYSSIFCYSIESDCSLCYETWFIIWVNCIIWVLAFYCAMLCDYSNDSTFLRYLSSNSVNFSLNSAYELSAACSISYLWCCIVSLYFIMASLLALNWLFSSAIFDYNESYSSFVFDLSFLKLDMFYLIVFRC
jgi:hypothetical protein